jgi:hypothetical protein
MQLDVNTPINNLDGEPLKIGSVTDKDADKETKEETLTLGHILINAALTPSSNKTYSGEEHVTRFQLALTAQKARTAKPSTIEVSAEAAAFIKGDISRVYAPLIAGQVLPMLDGK